MNTLFHSTRPRTRFLHTAITGICTRMRHKDLEGSAVIETVIVIAVIVAIALIFNTQIRAFAERLFNMVFNDDSVLDALRPN